MTKLDVKIHLNAVVTYYFQLFLWNKLLDKFQMNCCRPLASPSRSNNSEFHLALASRLQWYSNQSLRGSCRQLYWPGVGKSLVYLERLWWWFMLYGSPKITLDLFITVMDFNYWLVVGWIIPRGSTYPIGRNFFIQWLLQVEVI